MNATALLCAFIWKGENFNLAWSMHMISRAKLSIFLILSVLLVAGCGSGGGASGSEQRENDPSSKRRVFHEEDDTIADANKQGDTARDVNIEAHCEENDDDLFRIHVHTPGQTIQAMLTFDALTSNLDLILLDESGTALAIASSEDTETLHHTLTHSGRYFLQVTSASGSADYDLKWIYDIPPGDDSRENDDSISQAEAWGPFGPGTPFNGISRDDDYFLIQLPAEDGVVDAHLSFDSTTELELELYTPSGTLLAASRRTPTGANLHFETAGPEILFLRIPQAVEPAVYSLSWAASKPPTDDSHEEDDTFDQADSRPAIPAGTSMSGIGRDRDTYRIKVTGSSQIVTAQITSPRSFAPILEAFSPSEDFLAATTFSPVRGQLTFYAKDPGTYYLLVYTPSFFTGTPYSISWTATSAPSDDPHEEDDSHDLADGLSELPPDTPYAGQCYDEDYFRITVPEGEHLIDVSLDFDSEAINLDLALLDAIPIAQVYSSGFDGTASISYITPWSGTHYLRVYSDGTGVGPYQLTWHSAPLPEDDLHEQDDSISEAKTASSAPQSTLLSGITLDDDFYRLDVPRAGEMIEIVINNNPSNSELSASLKSDTGPSLAGPSRKSTEETVTIYHIAEYAGPHFLHLSSVTATSYDFTWTTWPLPPEDTHEEDDTTAAADMQGDLPSSTPITATCLDQDIFRISVPDGEELLTINISCDGTRTFLTMDLRSADGEYYRHLRPDTETDSIPVLVPNSGTYYLSVSAEWGASSYELEWISAAPPGDDDREEDDTIPLAKNKGSLPMSTTINGTCLDDDLFRIEVPLGEETVTAFLDYDGDPYSIGGTILDSHGHSIGWLSNDASLPLRVPSSGIYYLQVSPHFGISEYSLQWSTIPAPLMIDN